MLLEGSLVLSSATQISVTSKQMLKRYLRFVPTTTQLPNHKIDNNICGWKAFEGDYDTLDEALNVDTLPQIYKEGIIGEAAHVVDTESKKVIAVFQRTYKCVQEFKLQGDNEQKI